MKRSPITRKTRLNPVNRARKAKLFQANFGGADYRAHIVAMPCALCGIEGYSEPAHAKSRGAGGDASDLVPLCGVRSSAVEPGTTYAGCHHFYDNDANLHAANKSTLRALAKSLRRAWLEHQTTEET